MLAELRPVDPSMRDRALVAIAFAAMVAELLAHGGTASDALRSLLFAALLALPLLWWRTHPALCAPAVGLVLLIGVAGAAPDRLGDASTPLIPIVVSIFGLAFFMEQGRRLAIAAGATVAVLCAAAALGESDVAGNIVFAVAVVFV